MEFGAFYLLNAPSGGNDFNEFPENKLSKFRAA